MGRILSPLLSIALVALLLTASTPLTAEPGPESKDGWPTDDDGQIVGPAQSDPLAMNPADPLNKVGPFTFYTYYAHLMLELERLADEYPDRVRLSSAGQTVLGLEIWQLEIADFDNPDKIPLEDREVILIDGGVHSNEYSPVYFVMELAQFLIEDYETNETARFTVDNRYTVIVPLVNADGSHAMGRINANGVNINRNFPYTWGETDEQPPLNDPGPYPASEPETRALIRLYEQLEPDYYASIHCCGNLWLAPWGAAHLADPVDVAMFNRTCDVIFPEIRDRCGPIWSTIYPASGSTVDEAYGIVGSASWGFEMSGRGNIGPWGQPVTTEDVRYQERESWRAVIHAFENVHIYGAYPEIVRVEGTPDQLEVTIENHGWGPLVAGNLTPGDQRVPLPELPPAPQNDTSPSNVATLTLTGDFQPGTAPMELDWTKRIHTAPQGHRVLSLELLESGDRLVGKLDGQLAQNISVFQDVEQTPLPGLALVLIAFVAIAIIGRRRR